MNSCSATPKLRSMHSHALSHDWIMGLVARKPQRTVHRRSLSSSCTTQNRPRTFGSSSSSALFPPHVMNSAPPRPKSSPNLYEYDIPDMIVVTTDAGLDKSSSPHLHFYEDDVGSELSLEDVCCEDQGGFMRRVIPDVQQQAPADAFLEDELELFLRDQRLMEEERNKQERIYVPRASGAPPISIAAVTSFTRHC